ncbi:MAG: putative glycosyl transferase group 1 [Candidatus Accumulibacter appositus]|uniref:Putative glycosyl transferase group 1 n=1 Tax=Candidatus Accumulibacter appositus TaxID=1454003 RepID=A0A011PZS7_9PROT|nr:glycosyltransferase family 1 protein [Accumulibacter sp.]EXI82415.1 MAG: putative glycosyl transferase group 1 [Candidatus Accumulibacter appositus]HRF02972.1 glycosyltransferase family 1 protein [Accumulibacter sp.]
MREVLIDVTRMLDRTMQRRLPTGVDRVSLEYARHFAERATALVRFAGQWIELSPNDSERTFDALLAPSASFNPMIRRLVARAATQSLGRRFLAPHFLFNTGHSGLEQAQYAKRLQRSRLRPIFFVHDLIPITHPEYCRPGECAKHRLRMNTVLQHGHGVITNSAQTLDELVAYAEAIGRPMPPAAVAPLAPARLPVPATKAPVDQPYFVILGTIEPRKNHWLLLHLWRQLVERWGAAAPRLVIIGQRGWECENVVDLLERCAALKGFVIERTACSDAELSSWLHHAQALLFPSFTEGFGMPLVEALSLGLPVIASDLPAFREIAGDIPQYLDPLDGKRWRQLIEDYAGSDSALRAAQGRRLKDFIAPTWDEHFELVDALMERLRVAAS